MVRIAEALRKPLVGDQLRVLRYDAQAKVFQFDSYRAADIDFSDPRKYRFKTAGNVYALTSLSWLLPVELDAQGLKIINIHYDKLILPQTDNQEYGIEDARITQIEDTYYMTTCGVASNRHATILYTSQDGLNYTYQGLILDHQNKDMIIFPEKIEGLYYALTRPQGELYFVDAQEEYLSGPGINLACSPDLLYWKPLEQVLLKPRKASLLSLKAGGGAPPLRTAAGWLLLFHGVTANDAGGSYHTLWLLLDLKDPRKIIHAAFHEALLETNPKLMRPYQNSTYLPDIIFTTGIVAGQDCYIVASGELDLCCRITHLPHSTFKLP